jgi:Mrp family chromosome partitioning ATPase
MKDSLTDPDVPVVEVNEHHSSAEIQETQETQKKETLSVVSKPLSSPRKADTKKARGKKPQPTKIKKRDATQARMLQERCRQLCLSLFYRELAPVRSLGFTSSIDGEGKSLLAAAAAGVLAHDSNVPVTLIECDWEHPGQHKYFDIPATPGLAEWLGGTCDEEDIRYQVDDNLTIIPAGDGSQEAVKLLKQVQQNGLLNTFTHSNELYIVDLPPILTAGYGSLAAELVESIVIVVRAQVIPDRMVAETCAQLKDLPIHGIILNHNESRIPRWIRQLL